MSYYLNYSVSIIADTLGLDKLAVVFKFLMDVSATERKNSI